MEEKFNLNSCRFVQEMITPTEGFGNDGNGEGGHHGCLVALGQDEGRPRVDVHQLVIIRDAQGLYGAIDEDTRTVDKDVKSPIMYV